MEARHERTTHEGEEGGVGGRGKRIPQHYKIFLRVASLLQPSWAESKLHADLCKTGNSPAGWKGGIKPTHFKVAAMAEADKEGRMLLPSAGAEVAIGAAIMLEEVWWRCV